MTCPICGAPCVGALCDAHAAAWLASGEYRRRAVMAIDGRPESALKRAFTDFVDRAMAESRNGGSRG